MQIGVNRRGARVESCDWTRQLVELTTGRFWFLGLEPNAHKLVRKIIKNSDTIKLENVCTLTENMTVVRCRNPSLSLSLSLFGLCALSVEGGNATDCLGAHCGGGPAAEHASIVKERTLEAVLSFVHFTGETTADCARWLSRRGYSLPVRAYVRSHRHPARREGGGPARHGSRTVDRARS